MKGLTDADVQWSGTGVPAGAALFGGPVAAVAQANADGQRDNPEVTSPEDFSTTPGNTPDAPQEASDGE